MKKRTTVLDFLQYIEEIAPFSLAEDFDNSGLLVGNCKMNVEKVLISLDLNFEVLKDAVAKKVQLIVTHHPVIFNPLKHILKGDLIYELVCSNISVICAHTNLDRAVGGVSDCLAKGLMLKNVKDLENSGGYGKIGILEQELSFEQFLKFVSKRLGGFVKASRCHRKIGKVAVVGGAGCFAFKAALAFGADAFITGEVKHNFFVEAFDRNFCLVDGGHFATEHFICSFLKNRLAEKFPDVNFYYVGDNSPVCYCFGEDIWL